MKVHIELEITPEEARRFIGLPDMTPIHDVFTSQAKSKLETMGQAVDIEPLLRTWGSMGGMAQDVIGAVLSAAVKGTTTSSSKPKDQGES